jgi:hypothetical protein
LSLPARATLPIPFHSGGHLLSFFQTHKFSPAPLGRFLDRDGDGLLQLLEGRNDFIEPGPLALQFLNHAFYIHGLLSGVDANNNRSSPYLTLSRSYVWGR